MSSPGLSSPLTGRLGRGSRATGQRQVEGDVQVVHSTPPPRVWGSKPRTGVIVSCAALKAGDLAGGFSV